VEWNIESVRQLKNSSAEDLARSIQTLAEANRGRARVLRSALDTGRLFRIAEYPDTDLLLVEAALLAIVLADVSGYDPWAKERQLSAARDACKILGVQYEEVLSLTESEPQILASFQSGS
jgi:hypothetical protein